MAGVDPELVRNNDGLRLKLQTELASAANSLCTMVEHKGRIFRDVEPVDRKNVEAKSGTLKKAGLL
jgi:hypothetical protein